MSDTPAPAEEKTVEERIDETKKLIRFRRFQLAQGFAAGDESATATELAALTKLEEVTLPNLEAFVRCRDLTREPV